MTTVAVLIPVAAQQTGSDTTPPQVFPPADITISHTETGGARPQDSQPLQNFLAGGKARDGVSVIPGGDQTSKIEVKPVTRLTPQVSGIDVTDSTLFPEGTTAVTFRFADAAGNVGTANANVTVLDLEDGDLFVGGEVADNGFGDIAVAGIYRVRGGQASVYCQSGSGSDFWAVPTNVMVDSKGRVVFLALLGSPFFNEDTGLLRCNSLGAPAEKLAVFRFPGYGAASGYPDPFPGQGFLEFNGLHLETSNNVSIDDSQNNGSPQISSEDSYVLSYSPPGPSTDPAGSLRYFPDTGVWVAGPPVGDVGKAGGEGWAPDIAFHDGATYVALGDRLLRNKNGLNVSVTGHAGGLNFGATLDLFGGSSEISSSIVEPICGECGLILNDRNTPDIDSGCQTPPGGASTLMPWMGNAFTVFGGISNIAYDEYTGHGLIVGTNEVSAGFPFLTQLSEAILDRSGVPMFTDPGLGCTVVPELEFSSVLPFYGQFGINGFSPLVSAPQGIVGVTGNGVAIMAPGASPIDQGYLINNQPWILGAGYHSGLGAWPPRVSSGMSANVIIRIDSPVNVLVTGPDGRRIGVDASGQAVNDFGSDGFDSGPGEPRFFAINNPVPGAYGVQVVGTGTGPYSVHIYSNDLTIPVGSQIVSTGTASPGSAGSADFDLADDMQVAFASSASQDTTPPQTTVSVSPQPNGVGWNSSDVTATLTATDNTGGSGVKQITYSASGGQSIPSTVQQSSSATIGISGEGQTTFTFFATDNAGNSESPHQAVVMLDKTPPSVNCAAPDGKWHPTDVSIPCTAADSLSGLQSSADSNFALATAVPSGSETNNALTGSRTVCDVAGNCSNAGPIGGNMIDEKAPAIALAAPANGATYSANQAVSAAYSCSDSGSGVASCAGTVASGSAIDTTPNGVSTPKSFIVNSVDNVGNASSQVSNYVVSCHYVAIGIAPSTVTRGGTITVSANVMSCTSSSQTISVEFDLAGPRSPAACGSTRTLMFTTPPFTIPKGTSKAISFPFRIPKNSCTGTYSVTSTTLIGGAAVDATTATLTLQ